MLLKNRENSEVQVIAGRLFTARPLAVWVLAASLLLTACGGGGGGNGVSGSGEEEINPPPSTTDTDGDGLTDVEENRIGTSTILADTDGDGLSDNEEVTSGGFNPLIADLPKIAIEVTDRPTIQLDVTDTTSGTTVGSYTARYAQGQSSSYSRSDTTATSTTIEKSERVYAETEVQAGLGGIGGSAKAGAESSVSTSATQENSTSVSRTSARESRQEFGRYREDTSTVTNTTESGSLTTTLKITNVSNLSFELARVEVIAKKRVGHGDTFQPVGTLRFEPDGGPQDLGTNASIEKLVSTDSPSVPLLKELMENPSGLLFSVSNYELNKVGDEEGRSFARLSQDVGAQTAQVVIDYGENRPNGADSVEQYMVATNVNRDPVTNEPLGISMHRVMSEILEIPYATAEQAVLDEDDRDSVKRRQALNQVRTLASQSIEQGFWYVYTSSESLDDPATDFGNIVLKPRDRITLVYLADADRDGLFNREEYLLGTDAQDAHSDSDGLDDYEEVRNGWTVTVDGKARLVTSDPLNADVDEDGLSDDQERALGTDPNDRDTDGDGIDDANDPDPTGFSRLAIDVEFTGPTRVVTGEGLIAAPADVTLIDARIDWGDGSAPNVFVKPASQSHIVIDTLHEYASDGDYTITLTVRSQGNRDEQRTYQASFTPRFIDDIGCCIVEDGVNESVDTRLVADLNNDGRSDVLSFTPTGVWTALSHGDGFDRAFNVSPDFATDGAFDKNTRRRMLAQVGGDTTPDIVMFDRDGVYVAINDGTGNFGPRQLWIADFGIDQGYRDFTLYPRMLGDMNTDGFADIVGFSADGAQFAISTGSGFTKPWPLVRTMALNAGGWDADNPRTLGDINGDGLDDLIGFGQAQTFVKLNRGNGRFAGAQAYNFMTPTQGYSLDRHLRLAVDIDRDGNDDLFTYANSGAYFARSNGKTLAGALSPISDQFGYNDGWRVQNDPRMFADINGDGLPDIVGFGPERPSVPGGVWYALNTGEGAPFEPRALWTAEFAAGLGDGYSIHENPRMSGDVNGDGVDDLIIFDDSQVVVVFSADIE